MELPIIELDSVPGVGPIMGMAVFDGRLFISRYSGNCECCISYEATPCGWNPIAPGPTAAQ